MLVEHPLAAVFASIVACLLGSLGVESLLTPRPLPAWRRPAVAAARHLGLLLAAYLFELAVFRRPWFAAVVVLVFFGILIVISNVKMAMLREPFVYPDFEYFTDAIRHPRLYLPFLGYPRLIGAVCAFGAAVGGGMAIEQPLTRQLAPTAFVLLLGCVAVLVVCLLRVGARWNPVLTFVPIDDIRRLGLLGSLWYYRVAGRAPIERPVVDRLAAVAAGLPTLRSNLVLIQSESFFDARSTYAGIDTGLLPCFDALKQTSLQYGKLNVPAWGANTVRTEFAVLCGRTEGSVGVHRFNPYRRLARTGVTSLATLLRAAGYRTVCIHPYAAEFYGRDQVMPLLGFDEFIDGRQFAPPADAPYVGDVELAERVAAELSRHDNARPIFMFVITMENHGPLHLEFVADGDVAQLYRIPPPVGCEDLTCYLRHQRNADRMLEIVSSKMQTMVTPGVLGFYGDHVPIMPKVYAALGEPPAATDYFVWRSAGDRSAGLQHDLDADALAGVVLGALAM